MQIHNPRKQPFSRLTDWQAPWFWLLCGMIAAMLALAWSVSFQEDGTALLREAGTSFRVGLVFLSMLAAGIAILRQPGSAPVVAAAAGVGGLGWLALGGWVVLNNAAEAQRWMAGNGPWPFAELPWSTALLLVFVLTAVAALASLVLLLPRAGRRLVVSFLIVFHFAGILSAVFSVPPAPWLATTTWTFVFRPYLDFIYLNNAYHFYSPDPGPPNLLWFRLEYADGSYRWHKLPNRDDYPTLVNYQRRLSLTESVFQPELTTDPNLMAHRQRRRESVEATYPAHPLVPLAGQFREPGKYSKRMIENYVRAVARDDQEKHPERQLVKIRLYRVLHDIVLGPQLALGVEPLDRWMYRPYYQGEFDVEGRLRDPNDPLLYWLIPIVLKDDRTGWVPANRESLVRVEAGDRTYEVYDFLKVHAGDYQ